MLDKFELESDCNPLESILSNYLIKSFLVEFVSNFLSIGDLSWKKIKTFKFKKLNYFYKKLI